MLPAVGWNALQHLLKVKRCGCEVRKSGEMITEGGPRWGPQVPCYEDLNITLTCSWKSITLTRMPISVASPAPVANTPSYEEKHIKTTPFHGKTHKISNHSVVMLLQEDVDSWNSPPVLSCNLAFGKSLPGMWHLETP